MLLFCGNTACKTAKGCGERASFADAANPLAAGTRPRSGARLKPARTRMQRIYRLLLSFLLLPFCGMSQSPDDSTSVYFPFDRDGLTVQARERLDSLAGTLRSISPLPRLTLKGYCDPLGTDAYNDRLSEKRVEAVRSYLLGQGIPAEAVAFYRGYGERNPVNENRSAEERQQNRRVDVLFSKPLTEIPPAPAVKAPEKLQERLDTVKAGQTLRLKNINFYGGRHSFLPSAMPALNELLQVMRDNPSLVIEIQGHICCFPGQTDGPDWDASGEVFLSRNRARAVYEYLAAGGIDRSRMSYKGFAGSVPLVWPEVTEADRTANRRVEIKIVSR